MSSQVSDIATTEIEIPTELYTRLVACCAFVSAVTQEETPVEDCLTTAVMRGLDAMLADIIGSSDAETHVAAMQQLAAKHPEALYGFVAETLERGAIINREQAKPTIGFRPADE